MLEYIEATLTNLPPDSMVSNSSFVVIYYYETVSKVVYIQQFFNGLAVDSPKPLVNPNGGYFTYGDYLLKLVFQNEENKKQEELKSDCNLT